MEFHNSLEFALKADKEDPLRSFRDEFLIPAHDHKEAIYFLGNSLGLQPKRTAGFIQQILDQWSQEGVEGFFRGKYPWLGYHDKLVEPLSSIVGALPHEVVVMNSLTVNLHLMLVSFYRPNDSRRKILCEAKAFPSDQYMLETHIRQRGLEPEDILIEVGPREGEIIIRQEDILEAIQKNAAELALVLWGGVNYYTGQVFDMESITAAAQEAGARVGFDLAHAAGNVSLQLHNWNVDFACWCSYKYLNSGPGAIGGAYIHERYHKNKEFNRFAGWWGYKKETRFLMQKGFDPVPSAEGWQLSTPSPVLYAAHLAALELFMEAGIDRVFAKGQQLSDYLLFLLEEKNSNLQEQTLKVITPREPGQKGCQISLLMNKNGREVFDALSAKGVYADWREPDVIRVAPVPLYNSFEEVWQFVQMLFPGY